MMIVAPEGLCLAFNLISGNNSDKELGTHTVRKICQWGGGSTSIPVLLSVNYWIFLVVRLWANVSKSDCLLKRIQAVTVFLVIPLVVNRRNLQRGLGSDIQLIF